MASVKEQLKSALIPKAESFELMDDEWKAAVERKEVLDRVKRYVEKELEALKQDGVIEAMLMAEGVEAVTYHGWVVKRSNGRTADSISATKLVELGVDPDLILKATVPGKPYTYPQIVRPKDDKAPITTWDELEAALPPEAWA